LGVANFLRNGQRRISYQFVAVIAIVRLNGVIIALNAPHLRSIKCFYSSQSESGHHWSEGNWYIFGIAVEVILSFSSRLHLLLLVNLFQSLFYTSKQRS